MEKRFEKIFLISFAVFAVGLGFWGYAIVGSDYTGGACLPTFSPPRRPPALIQCAHSLGWRGCTA